jgi:hypothetical protein
MAGFRYTLSKGANERTPIYAAPLMGPPGIVALAVAIEHLLHLLSGLNSGAAYLDPEALVDQRAMETFREAMGFRLDLAYVRDPYGNKLCALHRG